MSLTEILETMAYGPAPESAAAVNAWLDEHNHHFGLFINNEWVYPEGADTYASMNPASLQKMAETTQAGQAEVDTAVAAARKAQPAWAKSGHKRARVLYAIARLMQNASVREALLEANTPDEVLRLIGNRPAAGLTRS